MAKIKRSALSCGYMTECMSASRICICRGNHHAALPSRCSRFKIDKLSRASSQTSAKALKSCLEIAKTDLTISLRITSIRNLFNPLVLIYFNKSSTAALSSINSSVEILIFSLAKSDKVISLTISTFPSGVVINGMPQIIPSAALKQSPD